MRRRRSGGRCRRRRAVRGRLRRAPGQPLQHTGRHQGNGQVLRHARRRPGAKGTFSLTDKPAVLGTYAYTAGYTANSATQAATRTRTVTITRIPTSLTLTTSKTNYTYKAKVTIKARRAA